MKRWSTYPFARGSLALGTVLVLIVTMLAGVAPRAEVVEAAGDSILINEFYRGGDLDSGDEWIELLLVQSLAAAELETFLVGDSTSSTASKFSAYQFTDMNSIASNFPAGTIIVVGGDTALTEDTSYNPAGDDWNILLNTSGTFLTGNGSQGNLAGTDVAYVDTSGTGDTISTDGFAVNWDISPGTFGSNASVTISAPSNNSGVVLGDLATADTPVPWTISVALGSMTLGQPNGGANSTAIDALRNAGSSDPAASATAPDIPPVPTGDQEIEVTYTDDSQIDSLGTEDISVNGPGYTNAVSGTLSSVNGLGTATATATYTIPAPDGTWDAADNGTYTIAMNANQVEDDAGNFVPAGDIGSFMVDFPACGLPATAIHAIQGSDNVGVGTEEVTQYTIEGVVVGVFPGLDGFFVQEEDSDADTDPTTSEGIFVYLGSDPTGIVSVGDVVRVDGTFDEFFDKTQLDEVTSSDIEVCNTSQIGLVTVTDVQMPFPDPMGGVPYLERYEGMLVNFPQSLVISEYFNFDRFGEIVLALPLSGDDRPFQPTHQTMPGTAANNIQAQNDARRITLDDGRTSQNPDPARHPNGSDFDLNNRFRGGDTVTDAIGALDYSFGLYRIQPTAGATYDSINPRPTAPDNVGGSLTVASFNVLNYFTTLDTGADICGPSSNQGCRGADNATEFERQHDKIVAALSTIDADIVGLIEIENAPTNEPFEVLLNGGQVDTVTVQGLNDVIGTDAYTYTVTEPIGTDAIRVAFIYKPDTVTPVGNFAVLDTQAFVDPNNLGDPKNRPALAQTFQENSSGEVLTVVVNHLKSKGSSCGPGDDDTSGGQGNCNDTRTKAAQELANWLSGDPTSSGDPDFLITGDLNAYAMEDPITTLEAAGYTDLIWQAFGKEAYSFVFSGQFGYLDHALANTSLTPQVTGVTEWHINADEPDILDYDTSFKKAAQDALYEDNAFRSSDHDPVIVGFDLDSVAPTVTVDTLTTSDTSPQLNGTINEPTTAISVTVGGNTYPATNNGDGTWTLPDDTITPALADGTYDVAVSATDKAGNTGSDSTTDELTVNTSAPTITVDTLTTSDTTPELTGTVSDPAATIAVSINSSGSVIRGPYAATNNGNGTWTLPDGTIAPALNDGIYNVVATATDALNNSGSDSTTSELTIDTQTGPDEARLALDVTVRKVNGSGLAQTTLEVSQGDTLEYTVQVSNSGPATAENVEVTLTLPSSLSINADEVSGSGWSCSVSGQEVTCTRASLEVGTAPAITVQATVTTEETNTMLTATVEATADNTPDESPVVQENVDVVVPAQPTQGGVIYLPIIAR